MPVNIAIAFDPGDTTGWATFNFDTGEDIQEGQVDHLEMPEWLTLRNSFRPRVKRIIIEDFRLLGAKAIQQTGSRFLAVQVIGMIRLWAWPERLPITLQAPNIKPIAERISGRKPVGAHSKSHSVDAYNHGVYWLRKNNKYTTRLERGEL